MSKTFRNLSHKRVSREQSIIAICALLSVAFCFIGIKNLLPATICNTLALLVIPMLIVCVYYSKSTLKILFCIVTIIYTILIGFGLLAMFIGAMFAAILFLMIVGTMIVILLRLIGIIIFSEAVGFGFGTGWEHRIRKR